MATTRNYISATGPDGDAARVAVAWLVQEAGRRGQGLLVVPSKAQLQHGVLVGVLGAGASKALAQNKAVAAQGSSFIEAITERTSPNHWRAGPVLVAYPNKSLLDRVDSLPEADPVLVLPWLLDEVTTWARQWGATPLGGGAGPGATALAPQVAAALQRLTDSVNASTGILHPSDRDHAIHVLTDLRDGGQALDPQAVREWLVGQGGWEPRHADDLAELTGKIRDRRRLRTRG